MKNPPQLIFSVIAPTWFYFPKEYTEAAFNLIAYSCIKNLVKDITFCCQYSARTAKNRNVVMQNRDKGDYILMIDSDMTFNANALELLLETSRENPDAVITGLGVIGQHPFPPSLFRWDFTADHPPEHFKSLPSMTEPFPVDACGSFCLLIPRHIADVMGDHAFDHIYNFYENAETKEQEDRDLRHDLAFCLRLREKGFGLICDPRVPLGHFRPYIATYDDWTRNRDNQRPKEAVDECEGHSGH